MPSYALHSLPSLRAAAPASWGGLAVVVPLAADQGHPGPVCATLDLPTWAVTLRARIHGMAADPDGDEGDWPPVQGYSYAALDRAPPRPDVVNSAPFIPDTSVYCGVGDGWTTVGVLGVPTLSWYVPALAGARLCVISMEFYPARGPGQRAWWREAPCAG